MKINPKKINPKTKILTRGAEAIIYKIKNKVVKDRIPKSYRHPDIDKKLRKRRTKSESKILNKVSKIIPAPNIISPDNKYSKDDSYIIIMDYIKGKRLSDNLEKFKSSEITNICKQIGKNIALLHDSGLIHGDLTTSNMILSSTKPNTNKSTQNRNDNSKSISKKQKQFVYFIDFGLGFHSDRKEDKAVDLHLISQALEAKHHTIHKQAFKKVLEGYKVSKNYKKVLERLAKVEKRGRYKQQY